MGRIYDKSTGVFERDRFATNFWSSWSDYELLCEKVRITIRLGTDRGAKQTFAFHITIQQGHLIYETCGETVRYHPTGPTTPEFNNYPANSKSIQEEKDSATDQGSVR